MFCSIKMAKKSLPTNLEFHLLIFKLSRETAYKASELDILLN
jgi:hypothetical protein